MRRVERYRVRQQLGLPSGAAPQSKVVHCRTPPPLELPGAITAPAAIRVPYKMLFDVDQLIKRSFETGQWYFVNKDHIIESSSDEAMEKRAIMELNTGVQLGYGAIKAQDTKAGFQHWSRAFQTLDVLLRGRYHDIVPNIIAELTDLYDSGHGCIVIEMMKHIAALSRFYDRDDRPVSAILVHLDEIPPDSLPGLEEQIMTIFSKTFEFYLGEKCYNSFANMMRGAQRKLQRSDQARIEDCLPPVAKMDRQYGPADRRTLDVLRVRTRTLGFRGQHQKAEQEALMLTHRAASLEDDWQRLYFCVKGLYYAGLAQFQQADGGRAEASFRTALNFIEEFRAVDSSEQFNSAKARMLEKLKILSKQRDVLCT
jgi:hypothetical protein